MDTGEPTPASSGSGSESGTDGVTVLEQKLEALKVQNDTTAASDDENTDTDPSATPIAADSTSSSALPADPDPAAFAPASPSSPFHSVFPTESTHSPPQSSRPNPYEEYPSAPPSPTLTRGFRSYNGSTYDDERNGGFQDDVDSLRGTYTRSLDVTEDDQMVDSETTERDAERAETGSHRTGFVRQPILAS